MPRPVTITDPADPEFPHGTPRGFRNGCHEPCCHEPFRDHVNRLVRERHRRAKDQLIDQARTHLAKLLDGGRYTCNDVAAATGLASRSVQQVKDRSIKSPQDHTLRAILAATPTQVARAVERGNRVPVDSTQTLAILDRYHDAEGWSYRAIAQATGLNCETIRDIHTDRRPRVQAATARALRTVTDARLRARARKSAHNPIPVRRTRQQTRSLRALGYPLRWQADQLGYRHKLPIRPGGWVYPSLEMKIDALYRRLDGVWADPDRDGLTPDAITRARLAAAKEDAHPPAAYTDDGYLIPEAVRADDLTEARKEQNSPERRRMIADLAIKFTVRYGYTLREAAEEISRRDGARISIESYERAIERARAAAGYVTHREGATDGVYAATA